MGNDKAPDDQDLADQVDAPPQMAQTARTTRARPRPPKFASVAKKKASKKAMRKAAKK